MPPDQNDQGTMVDPGMGTQDPTKTEVGKESLAAITAKPEPDAKPEPAKDAKPDDAKTLLNKKDEDAKPGAPEKYEDYKVPEGFELDKDVLASANGLFKELGISQEGAQKLMDLYMKETQKASEAPVNYWKQMREGWVKEITADKDIGPKIKEVRGTIGKVLTDLGPLEAGFREAMDLTGAGDHPAFVRAMYKWAQMLTEGGHVAGKGPSELGQRSPNAPGGPGAHAMFPNLS